MTTTMRFTIDTPLQDSPLTPLQKRQLHIGGIHTFSELLVLPLPELAKRCKISVPDARSIHSALLRECPLVDLTLLNEVENELDEVFTTGDPILDQALGGGIRTGMLWEICGESSAGKTQVALQASLAVQLPYELGGISGSSCYLTTSAKLPTGRLKQLSEHHPRFSTPYSQGLLGLHNVHTLSTSTIPILDNVLGNILPNFVQSRAHTPNPIKLVVVDALTELFHSSEKTTKTTIFTRSKDLNRIASSLHNIASTYNIAILVLNEVIDRFDRSEFQVFRHGPKAPSSFPVHQSADTANGLVYADKSRWFNTCNSISGEDRKEASLGLVWANQLNVRIMLTKTGRRRYLNDLDYSTSEQKKAKLTSPTQLAQAILVSDDVEQQATLVRRMSVVFSSVAQPLSLDYVVTTEGVRALADDTLLEELKGQSYIFANDSTEFSPTVAQGLGLSHTATASPQQPVQPAQPQDPSKAAVEEDEWDRYWEAEDDISQHFDDFDALEMSLTQAPIAIQEPERVAELEDKQKEYGDEEVPTSQPDEEVY